MKNIKIVPVLKNDEQQLVPTVWRETIIQIVEAFKNKDYKLDQKITSVESISKDDALMIAENIEDYGDSLITLPNKTWKTSACLYMGVFWEVFVDLYTEDEGHSDLVLAVKVFEANKGYTFKVHSVYVP